MAKELPYFKFEPSEWDSGNIQMCSRESKGLFIDLCSLYWSRLGELPYALALQKLCNGNKDALQELIQLEIIGMNEGNLVIEFLEEQLSEFGNVSEKRRKAAQKRWKDANAMQMQSKSNAIREEKIREEETRKEEITREKNFEWYLKQFDEMFVETLKMTHKGKDFMQAAKESFAHLAADPIRLKMAESHDCKKLLNTWLTNQKNKPNATTNPIQQANNIREIIKQRANHQGN